MDLGDLRLGILHESLKCVELLTENSIDYLREDGMYRRIPVKYDITEKQFNTLLDDNPLVIVRLGEQDNLHSNDKKICGDSIIRSQEQEYVDVLVKEDLHQTDEPVGSDPDARCNSQGLSFDEDPGKDIPYFDNILTPPFFSRFGLSSSTTVDQVPEKVKLLKRDPKRPLFGYGAHKSLQALLVEHPTCSQSSLRTSLQTAVELEWATLPLYLTSLYTIKSGANSQGEIRVFNVSLQEMIHFGQANNLLISVGGVPIINASTAPSYPTKGLPGGVLQNLPISLKKLSIDHVYNTFMGVEIPRNSSAVYPPVINDLYTIGAFYNEILSCMKDLGNQIFANASLDKQVVFPWLPSRGVLYQVDNLEVAEMAINEIIDQGEGTSPVDPVDVLSNQYAHYYKFEEIVCQRGLIPVGNMRYAYQGNPVPFNATGVYNMVDNPGKNTIPPNTECYNATREFNAKYVTLMKMLEETFTENPSLIGDAVSYMKNEIPPAAQYVVQLPLKPGSPYNCGPVWDLDWD